MFETQQKKSGTWIGIAAIVAAAVVAVGAYLWVRRSPPAGPAPEPVAQQAPPAPADAKLPTAEETDARIRAEGGKLSSRPELADWLKQSGLLERWVAVTDNLSEGVSPRKHLAFLAPAKGFRAQQKRNRTFIDPRSYARYDIFADVVASIDAKGFAALVRDLHPLLQSAYHALGYPNRSVDTVAAQALQRLVAAPVADGPVVLTPGKGALYLFADEKLEKQGAVEKHLLRMGPRNTKLIQAKAREIAQALELPTTASRSP
ncbi:MAG TPA: DUF3014 domain-containing protein [Myxococcales bacterium]|nr:DUF3014 domain-containing protein [Myxococcales bacterium]